MEVSTSGRAKLTAIMNGGIETFAELMLTLISKWPSFDANVFQIIKLLPQKLPYGRDDMRRYLTLIGAYT